MQAHTEQYCGAAVKNVCVCVCLCALCRVWGAEEDKERAVTSGVVAIYCVP